MTDVSKQIIERKYRDARRFTKPSGHPTSQEQVYREKVIRATLDAVSASAVKLIEYGVPEKDAYTIIFNSVTDAVLDHIRTYAFEQF